MKRNLFGMLRSGIALIMALCMIAGFVPAGAFATETDEIKYVSIGDSMANGYCFVDYHQSEDGKINFMTGEGVYGLGAYPDQFAAYLEANGAKVDHTKLAVSALRAEDLNYLLGGREEPQDGWQNEVNNYACVYDDAVLSKFYQDSVRDADIITLGVGNASFGAFMLHRVTDSLGLFGASLDEEELVDLEDALVGLDEQQKQLVLMAYDMLEQELLQKVPADIAATYNLQVICDIIAYTVAGYLVNYKGCIEQIMKLNGDAEIILVGLMNTTYGMNITMEGMEPIAIGDMMDGLFDILNTYMAGLPTLMQMSGEYPEAKFYYADQPEPLFISQQFAALKENGWQTIDNGRLSGTTVRERNITAYNDTLRYVVGAAVQGAPLEHITLADVQAFEAAGTVNWGGNQAANAKNMSVAIYLGIEDAVAASCNTLEIPLTGLMKIAGDLGSVFSGLMANPGMQQSPSSIRATLGGYLTSTDELMGMCKIYALFKVGNGMSVHPTPAGHDQIAASVIEAYEQNITANQVTQEQFAMIGELTVDNDFKYVAIGDASADSENYAQKLAAMLNTSAQNNGVGAIDFVNRNQTGNTVITAGMDLSDVMEADLVTIGFSNVTFLNRAMSGAINGAELDWVGLVGEENMPYVQQVLDTIAAKVENAGVTGTYADMMNVAMEVYVYAAVEYAVGLPKLIDGIRAMNSDALIVIVGMYNPLEGVAISLGEGDSLQMDGYVDYLVKGMALHGVVCAMDDGNAAYVHAPQVETMNSDMELSFWELVTMAYNNFAALNPNAESQEYIAQQIFAALNVTYVQEQVIGLLGDINMDGRVNSADVSVLFRYVSKDASLNALTAEQLLLADVNQDGLVNSADVSVLFRYISKDGSLTWAPQEITAPVA